MVAGVAVLLIVLPVALLWYGLTVRPDYWPPPDPSRQDTRQVALRFEEAMRASVRSEWTIDVPQDQLNAWLATRVTEWGADRGVHPRTLELIGKSMIAVDLDGIEVAWAFRKFGISGVVRLRYRPVMGEDKRVRLAIQYARAGIVPVPVTYALESILASVPRDEAGDEGLFERARMVDLTVPTRDGRRVSVVDVTVVPGKFVVTSRTTPR